MNLIVQAEDVPTRELKDLHGIVRGSAIERISEGAFRITRADESARTQVAARCAAARLDWGFVEDGRRLADFGLIAMDMDSTLISIEVVDEIADFVGRKAEVAAVTACAVRGEIDWLESLHRRVKVFAGLDASALARVYAERLALNKGAEQLISAARRHGVKTLLVSGGFTYFTDRVRERLGIDYAYSNRLDVKDGKLLGTVSPPFVDAQGKVGHVERIAREWSLGRERVLAIGDGANDLPMMAAAGLSVAYHAKPRVRERAHVAIDSGGLDRLLEVVHGP